MSSELVALALSAGTGASAMVALFSKRVSVSLIALFYASVLLGVTFTVYGDSFAGLITMVTFAGAVSVLMLTVILITGKSRLEIGSKRSEVGLGALAMAVVVPAFYAMVAGSTDGALPESDTSLSVVAFLWQFRPWDLLILIMVFAAAMLAVVNLLSGDS